MQLPIHPPPPRTPPHRLPHHHYPTHLIAWDLGPRQHPCRDNLALTTQLSTLSGINRRPEFVNLYFPYAGWGLLFFRWQWHFEFQPARVAVEGRSSVVLNTHARQDFLAYCTRPVSVHLAMACTGCSLDSFSVFWHSLKQRQNLMKIVFSCIHFPVRPYPPK